MNRDSLSDFACAVAGASTVLATWEEGNIVFPARLATGLLFEARARYLAAERFGEDMTSFAVYYAEIMKALQELEYGLDNEVPGFSLARKTLEDMAVCLENEITYYTENHAPIEEYLATRPY